MTRINFHAPDQIIEQIKARGDLSEALREALSRYYYLLSMARADLRGRFTDAELTALCAVGNGTIFEPHTLQGLLWNIEDSEPDEGTGLDVEAKAKLVEKLKGLNLLEHAALTDAVERFWKAVGTGVPVEPKKILDL